MNKMIIFTFSPDDNNDTHASDDGEPTGKLSTGQRRKINTRNSRTADTNNTLRIETQPFPHLLVGLDTRSAIQRDDSRSRTSHASVTHLTFET